GREAELLADAGGAPLRRRGSEGVRDGAADREQIEIAHGVRGHPHVERAGLALELDHPAPAQLALEADVARDRLELTALHPRAAALPPRRAHDDRAAERGGAQIFTGPAQQDPPAARLHPPPPPAPRGRPRPLP